MGRLYIVPTPIGNLEDITLRAIRILKEAECILSEDTRTTRRLLDTYQISTPCMPYHKFNEHGQLKHYLRLIEDRTSVALVSDAGTPGISDPGFLLIRECVRNGIEVECLPGTSACITAVVNSGIPCDRFYFYGFLPHKKGRQTALERLSQLEETFVLYESPHRIVKALEQLLAFCGAQRPVCVSRELTKIHEENFRGTLEEAVRHFSGKESVKGEITLVVGGKNSLQDPVPDDLEADSQKNLP
ncbi:MAG: 16S rRNA (cytidine(1402)-2'-O)-methyltransferase [Bacteroidales bacterium]|nr:16S rRNA (cytidine(1402)-2'-O)-methyltransferase [Bacteroidales bacterium]